jgi:hypothetical protein
VASGDVMICCFGFCFLSLNDTKFVVPVSNFLCQDKQTMTTVTVSTATAVVDNISPILPPNSNFILEHYVRPDEIQNCLQYSGGANSQQCACALSGVYTNETKADRKTLLRNMCEQGYQNAPQATGSANEKMAWCFNNAPNLQPKPGTDVTQYDAWVAGCLSGITGSH